ncbi:hypothetical protein CI789_04115 [Erwinia persicina]|nr:hypothetical protein CI789_04115 [Erwinia persicina]
MMTKYFVADIYAHASEHMLVNSAFIDFFSTKDTVFLLNDVHSKSLPTNAKKFSFVLKDSKIKRKLLRVFNREVIKTLTLFIFIPYILLTKRTLCILGASNIQFFLLAFIPFLKIKQVVHGQAEALIKNKNDKTFAEKLFSYGFKHLNKKNVNLLFLSKHINKKIDQCNFYFIDHPLPESVKSTANNLDNNTSRIKIAMVGLIRDDKKNCNAIYDMKVNPEHTELWVIGRAHRDFVIDQKSQVMFKLWDSIYSQEEFNKEISEVDGFLYLFNDDQYLMTASATALDAIIHKKYVFTLSNPAIDSLLSDYPYVIRAENISDLVIKINEFSENKKIEAIDNGYIDRFLLTNPLNSDVNVVNKWLS